MKIYIETLGCPKNFNDSQVAAGILESAGHLVTDDLEAADAIMVNTCGFINDAKTESIDRIFQMANLGKLLLVSGCLTQRYGEELYSEMPEVDIFLGVNDYDKLPEILEKHIEGKREKHLSLYEKELEAPQRKLEENPYSATIKIAEGCDNRCTYCIIPHIRGPYRSRPKDAIIKEAEKLAKAGTKEIILIAQDTTAWGIDLYGEHKLYELVSDLCKIDGIKWIRLMYCYEDRITDELIETMTKEPKVCNYLDIPIQHGSDKILAAMDRRSTRKSIEKTVEKLRKAMPDIHIRTTLITGFPGESHEDFEELLSMVESLKFERLGVFAYSPEEGTPAADMENQIDEEIKEQRKDTIMRRQLDISCEANKNKIGEKLDVMICEKDEEDTWLGRTQYDAPEIDCSVIISTEKKHKAGDIIKVKIEDAFDYDLVGKEI